MKPGKPIAGGLSVVNSTADDMDIIFSLFNSAIEYQQGNGYDLWPQFSRQLIEAEIKEGRHWKMLDGNTIACIFSILYNDPVIWGEKDNELSVYLHRIAVNPVYKGRRLMHSIRDWAIEHAKQNGRKYVRMDTWGNNKNLREYYIRCGFSYLGQQYLEEVNGVPAHYGGPVLSLFQVEV